MARSPDDLTLTSRLYRRLQLPAITVTCLIALMAVAAQTSRTRPRNKGPRAVGLVQIAGNGKGRIIPISIMFDGKFYDAASYKATPVPMALQAGTVYEAFKIGVSQGLFTIKAAIPNRGSWVGEGSWTAAGSAPPPKKVEAVHNDDDLDRPPVLRHADESGAKPVASPTPSATATPTPSPSPTPAPAASSPEAEDQDRPVLRRGKPEPETATQPSSQKSSGAAEGKSQKPLEVKTNEAIRTFAAVSDEGGPEARPYSYSMKPDEEAAFRKKMLALAADALRTRNRELSTEISGKGASKGPKADVKFENEDLRVFDLSSSNEPILVLSATGRLSFKDGQASIQSGYFITLISRQDLYGELHKIFVNVTDPAHLDAVPRMDLVDAVDADGDGRGELLFRSYSDAGDAYSIYRVIGDQLYPLYEGAVSGR